MTGILIEHSMTMAGIMIGKSSLLKEIFLDQHHARLGIFPAYLEKKGGWTAAFVAAALVTNNHHAYIFPFKGLFQLFQVSKGSFMNGDNVIISRKGPTTALTILLGLVHQGQHLSTRYQNDLA